MTKILKNASKVLFSLLLLVSIFGIFNVLAKDIVFKITNIEVKEKSAKVVVNDVSLSGDQLVNNILFSDKGDYIKYNITIKNTTEKDYTIKSITDDNTSPYLEYSYDDLTNVKVEAGKEKTFELQIKYIQETNDLTISDKAVSITLTYESVDGDTDTEVITSNTDKDVKGATQSATNPNTNDNLITYIVLGIVSLIGLLFTVIKKRHLSNALMIISLLSVVIIPLGVKALTSSFTIVFKTNKIQKAYTELIPGKDFNIVLHRLASGYDFLEIECVTNDNSYGYCYVYDPTSTVFDYDENIETFARATEEQYNNIKDSLTDKNIVSTDKSNTPTYIWLEDGSIYYYSKAHVINMNADSSHMFYGLRGIKEINLGNNFDASKVTNMSWMFSDLYDLEAIDLGSNFDTSKVTDMTGMFSDLYNLNSLNLGDKFDTSKVTSMAWMFYIICKIESLDLGDKFDTSKVTNMNSMFSVYDYDSRLASLDLGDKFNTSKVTNMDSMFQGLYSLKTIDFGDQFDTKNVTDMNGMFFNTGFEELVLPDFDTSNVTDMNSMFSSMYYVETIDLGSAFETSSAISLRHMFSNDRNLQMIYAPSDFDLSSVQDDTSMFLYTIALSGGQGTIYNYRKTSSEYARIDDPDNNKPGYFTLRQN